MKSNDFLIIGKENKEEFSYFSTMEPVMSRFVRFSRPPPPYLP